MALPSSPDISRKQGWNQPSVCVVAVDTCFVFASSNAVLTSKSTLLVLTNHASSRNSFLPAIPKVFQQVRDHHLQLLAAYPVDSPTCKLFSCSVCFFFPSPNARRHKMHTTWTSPMCCSACSFRFLPSGQRPVSSKKQFHDLPRASRIHQTQKVLLKTPRNNAVVFPWATFDHLAHDRSVLALACKTKSIVISVLRLLFEMFLLSCASVCFLLISVHFFAVSSKQVPLAIHPCPR